MPVDTTAVQISINVVDSSSGEVIANVIRNLDNLGDAGTRAGQKATVGLGAMGGHTTTNLDNVRLLSQEFGMRLPRAMESAISRSAALSGAIGAASSALLTFGAVEVVARMGIAIYNLYEKWIDTNRIIDEYTKKADEAASKQLFDTASFETAQLQLKQINEQIDQLQSKRANSSTAGGVALSGALMQAGFGSSFFVDQTSRYFSKDDAESLNSAHGLKDQGSLKQMDEQHQRALRRIEDQKSIADASSKGSAKIQADLAAENSKAKENLDYIRQREQMLQEIANRNYKGKTSPNLQIASNAGQSDYDESTAMARAKAIAEEGSAMRQQREQTAQMQAQAREAGLEGEAKYMAERDAQLDRLRERMRETELSPIEYAAQRAAVIERFDNERMQRLKNERDETQRMQAEASTGGKTGIARIYAQRDAEVQGIRNQSDKFSDPGTANQRIAAVNTRAGSEADQASQNFYDRIKQLDDQRAAGHASNDQRIDAETTRTAAEITKAWQETYGQLAAADTRRVQSYQALQREIAEIDASAAQQKREAAQKLEDETESVESDARRKRLPAMQQETQQIVDEYNRRVRAINELEQKDVANSAMYERQKVAYAQEASEEIAAKQRQERDKLAGQFASFFKNPLQELQRQGTDAAGKIAADFVMHTGLGDTLSGTGKGGGRHGGIFNIPQLLSPRTPGIHGGDAHAAAAEKMISIDRATINIASAEWSGRSGSASSGSAAGVPSSAGPGWSGYRTSNGEIVTAGGGASSGSAGGGYSVSSSPGSGGFFGAPSMSGGGSSSSSPAGGFFGASSMSGGGSYFSSTSSNGGSSSSPYTGSGSAGPGFASNPMLTQSPLSSTPVGTPPPKGPGIVGVGNDLIAGYGAAKTIGGLMQGNSAPGTSGNPMQLSASGGDDPLGLNAPDTTGSIGVNSPGDNAAKSGTGAMGAMDQAVSAGGDALGLYSAYQQGGVGGMLTGAVSGAKLGAMIAGPMGAAVGALAGLALGAFGGREKARLWWLKQGQPRMLNDMDAFDQGSMDYLSAYTDIESLRTDAKHTLSAMGIAGKMYLEGTVDPALNHTEAKLTQMQKAGRSASGFSAAQYDIGTDYVPRDGMAMIHQGERIMPSDHNERITSAMEALAGGGSGPRMPAMSGGGDTHLHVHAIDAKSSVQFLMDNAQGVRAALNRSYSNYGGLSNV